MRLGYRDIHRFPIGYFGWKARQSGGAVDEAEKPPALSAGDRFPSCRLVLLNPKRDREYLGVGADAQVIRPEDVRSDFLLISIYSELCPGCIQEMTIYSALYRRIIGNERSDKGIRMIGIGTGSRKREVAKFRKTRQVEFPLFADEKKEIFSGLGRPDLPVAYLIDTRNGTVLWVKSGHSENARELEKDVLHVLEGGTH